MFRIVLIVLTVLVPVIGSSQQSIQANTEPAVALSTASVSQPQNIPYEDVPRIPVATLLTAKELKGGSFDVDEFATADGMLYTFHVKTRYGQYDPRSLQLLRIRLAEFKAMEALARLENDKLFLKGATEQIASTVDATGKAILHPVKTIKKVPLGLNKFKNDIQARQEMGTVYGESGSAGIQISKRKLAHQLGINPYTDNRQLQEQLNRVARNKNYGSLVASIGTWFVPGGAGVALGVIDINDDFSAQLRDMSAAEIQLENRRILDGIGCSNVATDSFLKRRGYTAAHSGAICRSLFHLSRVRSICDFLKLLPEDPGVEGALFCQSQIQMAAAYHQNIEPISEMLTTAETPVFVTQSGQSRIFLPLDHVYWNAELDTRLQAIKPSALQGAEIWIAGTVTEAARRGAGEMGYTFHADALQVLQPGKR